MDTSEMPQPNHGLARLSSSPGPLARPLMIPPPPRPAQANNGGINLSPRMVLRAILRHWWQALALWIIGTAALGVVIYMKFKPEYRSFSTLKIEPPGGDLFDRLSEADNNYMSTQVQLITTPRVLSNAVQSLARVQPRLKCLEGVEDAETELREILTVRSLPGTYLIQVSAQTASPNESAQVVDHVVKAFLDADEEWSAAASQKQIETLEEYDRNIGIDIERLRQDWMTKAQKNDLDPTMLADISTSSSPDEDGQTDTVTRYSVDVQQYANLRKDQIELEFQIAEAKALIAMRQHQLETSDPVIWSERQIERMFQEDPDVAQVISEIQSMDEQLATLGRRILKPGDPTLTNLRSRRDALYDTYRRLWTTKKEDIRMQLAQSAQSPEGALREAEKKIRELEVRRGTTQQMISNLEVKSRDINKTNVEVQIILSDLKKYTEMQRAVERRLEQLRFDLRKPDRVVQIDEARPIPVPLSNKRNKLLAMAPIGMLGLVLAFFTLLEMRAGRVGTPDELSARVPVEVFSVPPLPVVRARGLRGPRSNETQFEVFVQQLDHLRVALCGEGAQHPGRGRCVLITSAEGGEGKTTLAAQLAVRCAEAGASTVLIDADLRRATLGKLFEVPECPGLSDVLRGDAELEDALVPISQVGGCQLLPAGSPEANPNRVLRGQRFGPMLEQLRRSFDVIIVDTSPVLPVPDALIMGRYVDGVVLAARHDRSRFPLVERANTLLTSAGIPVLGVVINGVQPSGTRFGAYAYSYRSDRGPADEGMAHGRVG